MLVCEVKLSQTFILQQVQKILTTIIFKISLPGTITLMYKLDQVCTDDDQKNYLWYRAGLDYHLSTSSGEIDSE